MPRKDTANGLRSVIERGGALVLAEELPCQDGAPKHTHGCQLHEQRPSRDLLCMVQDGWDGHRRHRREADQELAGILPAAGQIAAAGAAAKEEVRL